MWPLRHDAPAPGGPRGAWPASRPAPAGLVAGVMAEVSTIGAYFAVSTDPEDRTGQAWRPFGVLFTDLGALTAMIANFRGRLNTTETRVAASILFQGLAARLWSPAVGAAVVCDLFVDLTPERVHWRPEPTGPLPLWTPHLPGWEIAEPGQVVEPLYHNVVTGLLEPLALAVQETTKIAPALLWGNAASALAGTLGTIAGQRPELAARAVALGRGLLSLGVLEGTGELAGPTRGRLSFARRSCCLYYRVPGGGMCGDCALARPRPGRDHHSTGRESTP
ncbi:(2Fe-2S)-binding protein [Streptosporangium sp. NPDC051023]|uniref:(2Fe-2S)-binding protein n=1 Tax=Streptosporangium sp. NPDC051023 TaxID=3155410 RepID=UPI00344E50C0